MHTVRMQIVNLTQKRKIRHELVVESRTSTDCAALMLLITRDMFSGGKEFSGYPWTMI